MSLYSLLREYADSYALAAICVLYLVLCLWHFRPGAQVHRTAAKLSIFRDDSND